MISCLHAGIVSDSPRLVVTCLVTIIEILFPSEGILIGFHVLSFWYVEELCFSQDKSAKAEDGNVHLNCKL